MALSIAKRQTISYGDVLMLHNTNTLMNQYQIQEEAIKNNIRLLCRINMYRWFSCI